MIIKTGHIEIITPYNAFYPYSEVITFGIISESMLNIIFIPIVIIAKAKYFQKSLSVNTSFHNWNTFYLGISV